MGKAPHVPLICQNHSDQKRTLTCSTSLSFKFNFKALAELLGKLMFTSTYSVKCDLTNKMPAKGDIRGRISMKYKFVLEWDERVITGYDNYPNPLTLHLQRKLVTVTTVENIEIVPFQDIVEDTSECIPDWRRN